MDRRMEKASQRSRSGCVMGDITKTMKPPFFLSHFVNVGVKWAQYEIAIRRMSKAKPLKWIGFPCMFWKSMWHHVAVRCRHDRYKIAKMLRAIPDLAMNPRTKRTVRPLQRCIDTKRVATCSTCRIMRFARGFVLKPERQPCNRSGVSNLKVQFSPGESTISGYDSSGKKLAA